MPDAVGSAIHPVPSTKSAVETHERPAPVNRTGRRSSTSASTVSSRPSLGERPSSRSTCTSRSESRTDSVSSQKSGGPALQNKTKAVEKEKEMTKAKATLLRGVRRAPPAAPAARTTAAPPRARLSFSGVRPPLSHSGTVAGTAAPSSSAKAPVASTAVQRPTATRAAATGLKTVTGAKPAATSKPSVKPPSGSSSLRSQASGQATSALKPPSRLPTTVTTSTSKPDARSGLPRLASKLPTLSRVTGIKAPTASKK